MRNFVFFTIAMKIAISICSSFSIIHATTWYVHLDSALNSIEIALQSYCNHNDTVLVGPGTYFEHISWPNNIQGIHLLSEHGPDTTIIDGGIAMCWVVDTTTVIDGFTIQNGYSYMGGGIYIQNGSPIITNNIITDNRAGEYGGGIYVQNGSPIIINNVISRNEADLWGGGIACRYNSSPIIKHNTIVHNRTDGNGGGILCLESSPLIVNNILRLNTAAFTGGGIYCWRSSPEITGNTITRNVAGEHGGGIYCWWSSLFIDSCTISSNSGDGIYSAVNSSATVIHNNIVANVGYGICNEDSTNIMDARYNWWGDTSGPGGFGPGIGDEVSQWVDYDPWLTEPVSDVEEEKIVPVRDIDFAATIINGPLLLPEGKQYKVFDIMGRVVMLDRIKPGVYFIEVDGKITQKVIKVR